VTAVDPRPPAGSASARDEVHVPRARRGVGATLKAYVALTKPRIIELLLVTTIPTMILAERGLPPIGLVVATLVGGTLAAASANTLNCYLDRDIDVLMHRTSGRPLVTGEVSPREALVFGGVLGVLSVAWMALLVNPVSAALTLAAIAFYVFVYTLGLKRRTPQNIVWGGAAGCMPVLIGWSAVTGTVGWAALILFGVVFLWTPPHYWPLSLRFKDDYAAAGVPMLPVVAAAQTVTKQIIVYSWAMVAVSLLLWPVAPTGWIYASAAVLAGGWFLYEAHAMGWRVRRGQPPKPMRLFHGSITYLTLLFVAVAVDAVILG